MNAGRVGSGFSVLQRLVRTETAPAVERCELCSEEIGGDHRHLFEPARRSTVCVCTACSILFARDAASNGRYLLIPERRLFLPDFELDDAAWDGLHIPVGLAFFVRDAAEGSIAAFYPGPMGQMDSPIDADVWAEIERANPILSELRADVEALLVNRARGARQHYLVPISDCFNLVGLIRMTWKGFGGGREVWDEIDRFFTSLRAQSREAGRPAVAGVRRSAGARPESL